MHFAASCRAFPCGDRQPLGSSKAAINSSNDGPASAALRGVGFFHPKLRRQCNKFYCSAPSGRDDFGRRFRLRDAVRQYLRPADDGVVVERAADGLGTSQARRPQKRSQTLINT